MVIVVVVFILIFKMMHLLFNVGAVVAMFETFVVFLANLLCT